MKQCYLLLTTVFLITQATAQTVSSKVRPYVWIGTGASWATASGRTTVDLGNDIRYFTILNEANNIKPLFTGEAGLGLVLSLGSRLSLQVEADVAQRGFRTTVEAYVAGCGRCTIYEPPIERSATGSIKTRVTYLTLPMLVSYQFGKWSALAGPYVAFALNAKQEGSFQPLVNNTLPYSDRIERTTNAFGQPDVGLIAGLSYAMMPRTEFQVRYTNSIVAATRTQGSLDSGDRVYLQSAQFSIRYDLMK